MSNLDNAADDSFTILERCSDLHQVRFMLSGTWYTPLHGHRHTEYQHFNIHYVFKPINHVFKPCTSVFQTDTPVRLRRFTCS